MDKGTEYEMLVQDIYQTIANENDANTVNVQHNVKIAGKSGQEHHIDVYYEFFFMGETHRVIIECKNYSNRVPVGRIRDFQGLLADIGDVKGIFVSKNGFQKGAIAYAQHYDIVLKELRYPTAADWKGRMKTLIFNINCCSCNVIKREFDFDSAWIKNKYGEKGFNVQIDAYNTDVTIKKGNGETITNLYELENQLNRLSREDAHGLTQTFTFENAFLNIPECEPLKINAVKYEYDVLVSSEELIIDGETLAKAIMVDVLTGERRLFRHY
jgi:hypothetical protein